jgi:hypothetical protein
VREPTHRGGYSRYGRYSAAEAGAAGVHVVLILRRRWICPQASLVTVAILTKMIYLAQVLETRSFYV